MKFERRGPRKVYSDVIDLRDFYSQPLGRVARRMIGSRIRDMWPEAKDARLVGLGYATPFLGQFLGETALCAGFMPAAQGVVRWPSDGPGRSALVEDISLPLGDASIDRVIIVHGVEAADALPALLREIWRVLAPGGRLMIIAPNRRGMWARTDTTPFGQGRPFSRSQLSRLLREGMFSPTAWSRALFVPPFRWSWLLRSARAWERLGSFAWPGFSGVILVEAVKEIYGVIPNRGWRIAEQLNPQLDPVPAVPRASGYRTLRATAGTPPVRREDWPTKDFAPD